jgi:hypothetical protein
VETPERSKVIDRFGDLQAKFDLLKPEAKEMTALASQIRTWIGYPPHLPKPNESLILEGNRYKVVVGAQEKERTITDMRKVYRLWGVSAFLERCKVTLGLIDKFTTEEQRAKFITEKQTGSRSLDAVHIPPQEMQKAA